LASQEGQAGKESCKVDVIEHTLMLAIKFKHLDGIAAA
jgi:hypothetical protein